MKKRIRTLCLLLLAAWILLPLCACGKGGNRDEEIHVDGEGWLTHVYRGTPFALPERYAVRMWTDMSLCPNIRAIPI